MKFKTFCAYCDIGLRAYNKTKCYDCGLWFCDKDIHQYVDESNISITKHARKYCLEHYRLHHNK